MHWCHRRDTKILASLSLH